MLRRLLLFQVVLAQIPFSYSQQLEAAPSMTQLGSSSSLVNLISSRDITELTQIATGLAAQAMKTNGMLIANSGPEVRPIPTNARPSEMLGQGFTNILHPARQLASLTLGVAEEKALSAERMSKKESAMLDTPANTFLDAGSKMKSANAEGTSLYNSKPEEGTGAAGDMIGQALRMFTGNYNSPSGGQRTGDGDHSFPTLRQLFPGADKNFGIRQGEGCLPFLGEFMKMAYGNCVKRADEKTWDAWGKEINNALAGGKIDLLKASKETCKMGAEREQCNQLQKAISECDILGSIQLGSNLQRSVARCDEITGLMDQNPSTILNQMNGLINGEVAQGLLNNFLGG